jgi:hypothetical protein
MMFAVWGTWQPERRGRRIAHRCAVITAFSTSVALMLWWCWLFFTGHWAS